jgi:DnaJ-domain-containing protein 1
LRREFQRLSRMTDYFALLGQPRRPWLDAEALKQEFFTRSSETHPDRVHGGTETERQSANQRASELNTAYACLREPRDRLRHLLELELGRKPSDLQEIPDSFASLFMEVASVCREADGFITRQAAITSPLLRAQGVTEVHAWIDRLMVFQRRIAGLQDELLAGLRELDAKWSETAARNTLLSELERICRWLGFLGRWQAQIQERMNRLMH